MPSFHANTPKPSADKPNVVFLVYDGIVLLDLVGPLHVFSRACEDGTDELAYNTHIASMKGGPVQTNTIVQVDSARLTELCGASRGLKIDTLVIVGGDGANAAETNKELVGQVAALSESARRTCSVCCGAFLLAAAGLLDVMEMRWCKPPYTLAVLSCAEAPADSKVGVTSRLLHV